MLKPTSEYLQIQPVVNDSFVQMTTDRYQEVGVVIQVGDSPKNAEYKPGMRVYFDSWLAKKYPIPNSISKEFYWFLHVDDVVAYETVNEALPA